MGEESVCQFCGKPPKQVWRGEVISFTCGTVNGDQMPRKMECWSGWVMKLQERIAVLETLVMRKPRTVREVAVAGGWHPEIKSPKTA